MTEELAVQSKPHELVFAPHLKGKRFKDLSGVTSGYLKVLGFAGTRRSKRGSMVSEWWCLCQCGVCKRISSGGLFARSVRSCGCMRVKLQMESKNQRGNSTTPEFKAWKAMIARCTISTHESFDRYGGRGISVCQRWMSGFDNFYQDVGPRPSGKHSIDRIDNDGNYEPGNVRWTTSDVQNRNRSNNLMMEYNGQTKCMSEWSTELGIPISTIFGRLCRGWSHEKALSTKPRKVEKATGPARTLTFQGVTKTISEWADFVGIKRNTMFSRIKYGWPIDDAIGMKTLPMGVHKKNATH